MSGAPTLEAHGVGTTTHSCRTIRHRGAGARRHMVGGTPSGTGSRGGLPSRRLPAVVFLPPRAPLKPRERGLKDLLRRPPRDQHVETSIAGDLVPLGLGSPV